MSSVIQLQERRKSVRKPVCVQATAKLGELAMEGTVRDFSGAGLFFEPSTMYVDGRFIHDPAEMVCELAKDDVVELQLQNEQGGAEIVVRAGIRWLGFSHDVVGFGAEFVREQQREAA